MNIDALHEELKKLLLDINQNLSADGTHLWEAYQKIAGYLARLTELHNELAWLEIVGQATPQEKKFRTMIVDKTMETVEKLGQYESRKLTAKRMEWEMGEK